MPAAAIGGQQAPPLPPPPLRRRRRPPPAAAGAQISILSWLGRRPSLEARTGIPSLCLLGCQQRWQRGQQPIDPESKGRHLAGGAAARPQPPQVAGHGRCQHRPEPQRRRKSLPRGRMRPQQQLEPRAAAAAGRALMAHSLSQLRQPRCLLQSRGRSLRAGGLPPSAPLLLPACHHRPQSEVLSGHREELHLSLARGCCQLGEAEWGSCSVSATTAPQQRRL